MKLIAFNKTTLEKVQTHLLQASNQTQKINNAKLIFNGLFISYKYIFIVARLYALSKSCMDMEAYMHCGGNHQNEKPCYIQNKTTAILVHQTGLDRVLADRTLKWEREEKVLTRKLWRPPCDTWGYYLANME